MNDKLFEFIDANDTYSNEDKAYWLELIFQLIKNTQNLEYDKKHSLRSMFSEEYWSNSVADNFATFGQIVAQLVTKELLPLNFAGKNNSNAKTYQLIRN